MTLRLRVASQSEGGGLASDLTHPLSLSGREYCAGHGPTGPPESGVTRRKQMKIRATHSPTTGRCTALARRRLSDSVGTRHVAACPGHNVGFEIPGCACRRERRLTATGGYGERSGSPRATSRGRRRMAKMVEQPSRRFTGCLAGTGQKGNGRSDNRLVRRGA